MKKDEAIDAEIVDKSLVLKEIIYPVTRINIDELLEEYKTIPTIDLDGDDKTKSEQFAFVLKGYKKFVKARTSIEKTRKMLKEPSLEYGRKVDKIAKEFTALLRPIEVRLGIQKDAVEGYEAKLQREAEEAEELRVEKIDSGLQEMRNVIMFYLNKTSSEIEDFLAVLDEPNENFFEEKYAEALQLNNDNIIQLKKMIDDKKIVENAEEIQKQKDEEARLIQEEENRKLQAEKNALAEQKAELEKQKAEFEARELAIQEQKDLEIASQKAEEIQNNQDELIKRDFEIICNELKAIGSIRNIATALMQNRITNLHYTIGGI